MITIENVTKRFGGVAVVDTLSLEIAEGEFFALLGPSGCGKTTLLRMLAGFETPDDGAIFLNGVNIIAVPPHRRPVNMMFQSYALFPHLSVEGNIAFGLRREGMPRAQTSERVEEMLRLVKLDGFGKRRPDQLSGGQKQRVALARALAKRPKLLLLDEPMAALDKKLREETQFELIEIQRKLGLTCIVVTHDQHEAMTLASRVGVMERGRLAQVGAPMAVYNRPISRSVAEFIGDINILECRVAGISEAGMRLACPALGLELLHIPDEFHMESPQIPHGVSDARPCLLAIRPERLRLQRQTAADHAKVNTVPGVIADIAYAGGVTQYRVRLASGTILRVMRSSDGREEPLARGEAVVVTLPPEAGVLLPGQGS